MLSVLLACASATPRGEMVPREEPVPVSEHVPVEPAPPTEATEAPAEESVEAPVDGEMRPRSEPEHTTASEPKAPPGLLADGSPCLQGADCASGICEGHGCSDAAPGTCAPAERACTRDRRPFCGCDGETFFSSSSCPGQRYARRGTCGEPVR